MNAETHYLDDFVSILDINNRPIRKMCLYFLLYKKDKLKPLLKSNKNKIISEWNTVIVFYTKILFSMPYLSIVPCLRK